jgi:hypothetical protein
MQLYYNYSIDCELPPEGNFGGPATWDVAERSTRGFVDLIDSLDLLKAASLFIYPDVAKKQRSLFREMADRGIEIGLHLHTMRYSRMKKPAWLGSLSYEEQVKVLRMAKTDLEEVIGRPVLGFRACYASANHFTFPAVEDTGFIWTSTSGNGNYRSEIHECWAGGWPFPYHPSRKNKLIPGNMKIYEMPINHSLRSYFQNDPNRLLDMRAETPLNISGPFFANWWRLIEENLLEMEKRDQPVRAIIAASHNASLYADPISLAHRNVTRVNSMTREICDLKGYEFTPASFLEIKQEADRVGAF